MIHDLNHTYDNWCMGCDGVFKEMGHGLSDITLDIIDPRLPPYYQNTRWICSTCNRAKGRTPPEQWGALTAYIKRWKAHQNCININPLAGLPLFECVR